MAQLASVDRSILKALDDVATCTNDVLLSIKTLLSPNIHETNGAKSKENAKSAPGHARAKSLVSTTKVAPKAAGKTKGHIRQLTVVEIKQEVLLSQQERVNLAFQVVNSCIKNLSQLAKEHVLAKRSGLARGDDAKSRPATKTTPPETALRATSPNARRFRAIDDVCKPALEAGSSSSAIASCACTALAFLRSHYKISEKKDSTFQVENGTLAVIGKCLDLDLTDHALAQLQYLKDRLLDQLGGKPVKRQTKKQDLSGFAQLLEFPITVKSSPVLPFAVKLQQHIWQVLLAQNNTTAVEELAAGPTSNSQHGTLSLLRHYASLPEHRSKGNRQMAMMSRIFLQLSVASSLSSEAIFTLRCSATSLQIEASTSGSELKEEEAKEFATRVGRYMLSFSKSSKASHKGKYDIAKSSVASLLDQLQKALGCSSELATVHRILDQLAVQAGQVAETKNWSEASSDRKMPAVDAVRLAAGGLMSNEMTGLLFQATAALQETLPKDKAGLDRLLVEVVGLRRAIHKAVSEKSRTGQQCLDTARSCLGFLRAYMGADLMAQSQRETTGLEERIHMGKKFAKPFISTVIICGLHFNAPGLEVFTALNDCCDLFTLLVEHDESFGDDRLNDTRQPDSSIFVTMSKLCQRIWNSRMTTHGSTDEVALTALKTSIKAIESWTAEEKELVGFSEKLYYLVNSQVAREDWAEANLAFEQLIQEYLAAGHLTQLAEQAASTSHHKLRDKTSVGGLLFRSLRSFVTIMLKSDLGLLETAYSTLEANMGARGLLLEWQLEHLAQYALQQRTANSNCSRLVQVTLEQLLQIYTIKQFPIRRLRVAVMATRLLATIPGLFDPRQLLAEYPAQSPLKHLGNDTLLKAQYDGLFATLSSMIALIDPYADDTLGVLEKSIETWEIIASSIHSLDDVNRLFDDVDSSCEHLEAIADLYALRREVYMEARTIEAMVPVVVTTPENLNRVSKVLCRLAEAYTSLGYSSKTHEILQALDTVLKSKPTEPTSQVRWQLANAEYCLTVNDHEGCGKALREAAQIAARTDGESVIQRALSHSSSTLNLDDRRIVARAAYLSGCLELQEGRPAAALRLASIAKCMLFKIWSSIEQIMPQDREGISTGSANIATTAASPASDDPSAMEDVQPVAITRSYSHLTSPQLRMLVPDLVQVAVLEMNIHIFRGAYHEAFAALKHANKISNYVGAGAACLCDSTAADLYVRSLPLNNMSTREDKIREARARVEMIDEAFLRTAKTTDVLAFGKVKARVLAAEEEPEEQMECLQECLTQLKELFPRETANLAVLIKSLSTNSPDQLADQLAGLKLEKQHKATKISKVKATASKLTKKAQTAKVVRADPELQSQGDPDCIPLAAWHGTLLRESVMAALAYHTEPDFPALTGLLEKTGAMVHFYDDTISQSTVSARLLFHQATEQMSADITYNALHDSVLAVPPPRLLENHNSHTLQSSAPTKAPRKGKTVKGKTEELSKASVLSSPAFASLLENAQSNLQQTSDTSLRASSVARFRERSQLVSAISLTTSACATDSSPDAVHSLACAYHIDIPSIRTRVLNRLVEHPDVEKLSKDDLRSWPSLEEFTTPLEYNNLDQVTFQEDFIKILPQAWNVVSLSLTADLAAMNLVRYRHGQSPFILRVPFAHRESEDPDEEVLDMSLAYERLRSIIKQHEFTPVEAGVTDTPDFKRKWWQRKHELDAELNFLLRDVEDQWFTTVKGIFSPQVYDPQSLLNFQDQLQGILVQHCPAKKGRGKKGKAPTLSLNLEPRVVELFIGLGDPGGVVEVEGDDGMTTETLSETQAMADGIHDLVRLILENLQFSGESVAIDEVDMDNVIIKIIDALKDYYAAIAETQAGCQHTVLILDNQLHGFPWESLPCLRNQSVSRLPSLADLRDRIMAARLSASSEPRQGSIISRTSGTSLLNPSGDLTKTAQRFQPWLNKLPANWAHLRNAPDDEGWRNMLSENELFLYVGHGSTSQYVRPRVVKKVGYQEAMDKKQTCAVSWLIGCSSVAIEDLGEFEPNGMVLSYLAAGSPAVLGALWDVGDIDADHFSITTGDYWGLWDESSKGLDTKLLPARKKINEEKKAMGRTMSMCEAVAKSRGSCKLPYLNGAAFVVYGIPVFLD